MSDASSSFQHLAPELRVFAGPDSLASLPRELERHGCSRAVVFCGASMAGPQGGLNLLRDVLGARLAGVYPRIRAHSPLPTVRAAAKFLLEGKADAVLALGGGSAIVTARAASIVYAEGQDVGALCTRIDSSGRLSSPRLEAPKIPLFVLPSTPSTACVKAGSAVLDPATGQRLAMFDPKTRAKAIFIHPLLIQSAGWELVQSASLNTLAMAVEGLESAQSDPLADALLMHSLRLIAGHLPGLREAPPDGPHREQLMLAAVLCGRGTDHAGGGLASVLGHAIGLRGETANGIVNAIVLPHTMRFNAGATGARLAKVIDSVPGFAGAATHGPDAARAIEAVEALLDKLSIPRRLRDIGLQRDELPGIAASAMQDWFVQRNPRPVTGSADVLSVLEAAW